MLDIGLLGVDDDAIVGLIESREQIGHAGRTQGALRQGLPSGRDKMGGGAAISADDLTKRGLPEIEVP